MAIPGPLTKADIVDVLKEVGVTTKEDLGKTEKRLQNRMEKVEGRIEKVEGRIEKVEGRIDKMERSLKLRIGKTRNEILMAVGRLATSSPTLSAFNTLKSRIDRFVSTS